jgi:hypothetical protein
MFLLSSPWEAYLLAVIVAAACIYVLVHKAKPLFFNVTKRHNIKPVEKTFYEQCSEFIGAIAKEESYYALIRLGLRIEEYFSEHPLLPGNYTMRAKVYEALMKRKQFLSPRAGNGKPYKLNIVAR